MEQPHQSLAIESFSYSWLSNHRASSASDHEGTSYSRFDRATKGSNRFDFNFDVPNYSNGDSFDPSDHLVDADELFSNGVIKPVFVHPSESTNINYINDHNNKYSSSNSLMNIPSKAVVVVVPSIRRSSTRCCFLMKRWRKSSKRVLRSFLGFLSLRPLCHGIGSSCSRKSTSRVDDIDRREFEASRSLDTSPQASPLILRSTKSSDNCSAPADQYWCHDLDSSIYEAVLHCKRSIEK